MNELLQAFLDERGIKAPQDLKGHEEAIVSFEEENKCSIRTVGDKIIWVASRYIHITPTENDTFTIEGNMSPEAIIYHFTPLINDIGTDEFYDKMVNSDPISKEYHMVFEHSNEDELSVTFTPEITEDDAIQLIKCAVTALSEDEEAE